MKIKSDWTNRNLNISIFSRKKLVITVFTISSIYSIFSRFRRSNDGGQFDVGEWLINYSGGYVRRGLFGELLLNVFKFNEPYAGFILLVFQSILYFCLIFFLVRFLEIKSYSWSSIAICCNPAVGLFIYNNWGLTRKEMLGITSLICLALARSSASRLVKPFTWIAILFYGFSCLSSEINCLLLPGFVFILQKKKLQSNSDNYARLEMTVVSSLSAISFYLSVRSHGNYKIVRQICSDIMAHGFNGRIFCAHNSAIDWLGKSTQSGLLDVTQHFPLYFSYIPLITLAGLPIFLTPWFRRYWSWCLVSSLFILPLFVLATDYGRWTFMLLTEIVVMISVTTNCSIENRVWNKFTTPLFIFAWGIPYYVDPFSTVGISKLTVFLYEHNFFYIFFHAIFTFAKLGA